MDWRQGLPRDVVREKNKTITTARHSKGAKGNWWRDETRQSKTRHALHRG